MSSEGLTVQQAIDEIVAADTPEKEETQQPAQEAPEEAAEDTEQPSDTTDDSSEAEEPGDAETPEDEPEAEAITLDPPKWWSKDKKEAFKALPPDLQAVVFEQEEMRERVVAKTKQESADARKASEEQTAQLQRRIAVIDQVLPQVAHYLQSKYANVDWQRAAQELDPQEYNRHRAAYEQEVQQLQVLQVESQKAQEQWLQKFDTDQAELLQKAWPDLAEPKQVEQRKADVAKFAQSLGATPQEIRLASANLYSVFHDAMRWRDAQAKMAARPKAQPKPAQPVAPVRPSAPAARTPIDAKIRDAQARFDRDPSISNLEALSRLQERAS